MDQKARSLISKSRRSTTPCPLRRSCECGHSSFFGTRIRPFSSIRPASTPFSESESWEAILRFLELRGDTPAEIDAIWTLYNDPSVIAMIPTPSLRAATVMFNGWREYGATADSIILGQNDTGRPFPPSSSLTSSSKERLRPFDSKERRERRSIVFR